LEDSPLEYVAIRKRKQQTQRTNNFKKNKVRKWNNYGAVMKIKKTLKALQERILPSTNLLLGFW